MLLLAKLGAIAILIWFYLTAKEHGDKAVKWAVTGFIGYWLTWAAVYLLTFTPLSSAFPKNGTAVFLISQLPTVVAVFASILIRKKLIALAPKNQ